MKTFIGNCVSNPFGSTVKLIQIIDKAKKISRKKFLINCDIEHELIDLMKVYPHSFEFYEYKNIMFYTNSAIEHFYK